MQHIVHRAPRTSDSVMSFRNVRGLSGDDPTNGRTEVLDNATSEVVHGPTGLREFLGIAVATYERRTNLSSDIWSHLLESWLCSIAPTLENPNRIPS